MNCKKNLTTNGKKGISGDDALGRLGYEKTEER